MKARLLTALSVAALTALAACGGHGSNSPLPSNAGPAIPGNSTFAWGREQLNGASYVGAAQAGHMQVFVQVRQQNAQALQDYATQVSDPSSPLYRHYLSPQEIGDRFGASKQDYQSTANYFVANGLSVGGWPQRLMISVAGPQAAMERAFHTKFGLYEKNGQQFIAPRVAPSFGASIPVTQVGNLVALHTMHTYAIPAPPRGNTNDTIAYSPQQLRAAFDFNGAYSAGYTGSGATVAIIGTGPVNIPRTGNPDPCGDVDSQGLATFYHVSNVAQVCERDVTPNGVTAGLAASGIPTAAPGSPAPNATPSPNPGQSPSSMFPFSGSFQTPPPVSTAQCTTALPACNPEDLEAQLDTQQVAFLAPGANVKFYLAYNAADCFVYYPQTCNPNSTTNNEQPSAIIGLYEADAEIQQVIADNTADVVSLSYGGGEPQQVGFGFGSGTNPSGYETMEFAAMAAEGMAVFVSSGDTGSAECGNTGSGSNPFASQQCVSYPAGDTHVTSVGGVNLPIDEFGQLRANMTAWGTTNGGLALNAPANASGSGGGVSAVFTAPSWQATATGATMREQPDVSLDADPLTGVTVVTNGSCSQCNAGPGAVGGTSAAAPEMAAMWALVVQACKASVTCQTGGPSGHAWRLGNAAPYFYSIYHASNLVSGSRTAPSGFPYLQYANVFYDVVYGNNAMPGVSGYNAGTGYDMATGLGVPYARHLITAVTNQ